ncbi:hypothetical protein [Flammeovirga sp. SJP92]|uniref:hypothetical protein n=1 Tax=Flammeovirga sp. SJP92 TaxID=1775430 RepID=UPI0007870739|nr:hypothetical protein [Flammeovirga sp. SJP92]KXX68309.1 hypothetical protein AVL50_21230 [Flammeovirga sp. SJP92]
MTKKIITKHPQFLLGLIFLWCILFFIFKEIIYNPNLHFLYKGGDALKNYFLFAFVSKYGNLEHINFPFGESLLYTDSVLLLSCFNSFISKNIIDISDYSIGILHVEMLLVFIVSYTYCYKIFRYYQLDKVTAVVGSLLLALGAPSNSRILLHFGLFFTGLLPFLIYQLITFSSNKRKNGLIILLFSFGSFFLHGYVGTLFSGLVIFYFLTESVVKKSFNFIYTLLGILPTLVFTSAVYLSDENLWRSQHPVGLFDYAININRIKPFTLWDSISVHENLQFNIWFYVLVLFLLLTFYRRQKSHLNLPLLLTGIFFIIYATSLFLRFQLVLEFLPQLEQTRDLQRFGWVSYFVIAISVIQFGYSYFNRKLLLLILCIGILESIYFMTEIKKEIHFEENIFNLQNYDFKNNLEDKITASIIYQTDTTSKRSKLADLQYQLALKYGISPINNYLSRHSIEERNIQKQFTTPFIKEVKPSILKYINQEEKIIILGDTLSKKYNELKIVNQLVYTSTIKDFIPTPISIDSLRKKALYVDPLSKNSISEITNSNKQGLQISAFYKGKITSIPLDELKTAQEYKLNIWLYHFHQDSLLFDKLTLYQGENKIGENNNFESYDMLSEKWGMLSLNFTLQEKKTDSLTLFAERSFKKSQFILDRLSEKRNLQKIRQQPLFFNELTIFEVSSNKKTKVKKGQDK